MKAMWALLRFSMLENLRSRTYLVLALFAAAMMVVGLMLTVLGGTEFPERVLVDTGLAMAELFCLLVVLINTAMMFLQDLETRSIYAVLAKPVPRSMYLFSRYIGLMAVTVVNLILMGTFHVLLIHASRLVVDVTGYTPRLDLSVYIAAIVSIVLKIGIIGALTLMLVIAMTSSTGALATALLVWLAGHFNREISFFADRMGPGAPAFLIRAILWIIPDFNALNLKDFIGDTVILRQFNPAMTLLYWVAYVGVALSVSAALFARRDL